ncbi:hypothetical protein L7F22_022560 [Adiantum nelumboides]|nr:hypothetical protein [Adiantum nelumboides]
MRAIKLPEPPSSNVTSMPEIFDRGITCVVRRAVIIGNGAPGAEHQCIGLINALGLAENFSFYRVNRPKSGYNRWLRWLPVIIHKKIDNLIQYIQTDLRYRLWTHFAKSVEGVPVVTDREFSSFVPEADARKIAALARQDIEREGPLLVVASGRDTACVAAAVKRLASRDTFVIQIQLPRRRLDQYDMVITPQHDYHALTPAGSQEVPQFLLKWIMPPPPDKHVVLTTGALHHADTVMLRVAAARWHDELAPLPKPLLVVNIGGPTRHCKYGNELGFELVSALKMVSATCGSIRISFSQRTPRKFRVVRALFGVNPPVIVACSSDLLTGSLERYSYCFPYGGKWLTMVRAGQGWAAGCTGRQPDDDSGLDCCAQAMGAGALATAASSRPRQPSVIEMGKWTMHVKAKWTKASGPRAWLVVDLIGIRSELVDYVSSELSSHSKVYIWDGQGPNPHLGHLAWADAFVITADSISMLSEACSTGKPVYVIGAEKCKWKIAAFHKNVRLRGVVRSFTGAEDIGESWSYPPLNDNAQAAARVQQAIAEHGWSISKS